MRIQVDEWLEENDRLLKEHAESDYLYQRFDRLRARAKASKTEFNLTIDDLEIPEKCPILGITISQDLHRDHWPSADRVDNNKGYTKGNVRVISNKANTLKNANTLETLEKIIQYLKGEI
jgi:hypothetical protein